MKMVKKLMLVAALAVVAGAVTASPAFATGVKWSSTGEFAVKGTLTLKKNAASAVTCNLSAFGLNSNVENQARLTTLGFPWAETKCSNGEWFYWMVNGSVEPAGSAFSLEFFESGALGASAPWSERTWAGAVSVPFTNGSGATASHVDFSETQIGLTNKGEKVTATGSLKITTRAGGLLTVSTF